MTNLFISIELSKNGQQVAFCAAKAAKQSSARLILFHAYRADGTTAEDGETDANSERYVQKRLDKLAHKLHQKTGVSITRLIKPSSSNCESLEVARLVKADLTVICDHNLQSGNASILSKNSDIPVITVSTAQPVKEEALTQQLTDLLTSINPHPAPLLEAI